MSENRHPGISMHKLPVGAGFIGLVFTVGCALIFLLGFPQLWYFVALSVVLGIALAIIFRAIGEHRAQRMKPLSILSMSQKTESSTTKKQDASSNLLHKLLTPHLA
jgi:hypothetical protein